ncbi:MAG: hypothetical protein ACREQ7_04065 [Candidatus Binatia bacterium]
MPRNTTLSIACLGWGSLIWDPRDLPIRVRWFEDGPLLPIEFARESGDGRITLVICDIEYRVRTYWALLEATDLETAKSDLAAREGIKDRNIEHSIGYWDKSSTNSYGSGAADIGGWAQTMNLDIVVWTNLQVGFKTSRGTLPPPSEVLKYLRDLSHAKRRLAEEYVRKAPAQIDTEYRRRIENEFGWFPVER